MRNDLIFLHVMSGGELPEGPATDVPPFFNDVLKRCVRLESQERPMFHYILLMIIEGKISLNS